jgi:hypothetical protein
MTKQLIYKCRECGHLISVLVHSKEKSFHPDSLMELGQTIFVNDCACCRKSSNGCVSWVVADLLKVTVPMNLLDE